MGKAIGIDLGTTYTCAAHYANDTCHIIPNTQGSLTTPSIVAFTPTTRLFGDAAKDQAVLNPANTVSNAKRLIGRQYDDPEVQHDKKYLTYDVIEQEGKPMIQVKSEGAIEVFSPEQISAMVLTKMEEYAEVDLGEEVTEAVVTVPAYFNDSQRQATKAAAEIAGLKVLRILNEPTAAAIAYGLDESSSQTKTVLIYDFGGGTLDLSLLNITDGVIEVKATAGNTHLGGEDFNHRLVDYFVSEFKQQTGKDVDEKRALRRLMNAAESAKRTLSSSANAHIALDSLFDGDDLEITVTRTKFEELCADLFQKALDPMATVLLEANIEKSQVDDVVLVGGSTRIPKIATMVSEFFGGKRLKHTINPDEAVAYGAAVQAAMLSGEVSTKTQDIVLVELTPISLGVEVVGQIMSTVIPKGTTIPTKKTKIYTTVMDYQTNVMFQVYEGEAVSTPENRLLGKFRLTGIVPAPHGVPKIDVTFDMDINGILNVSAVDKGTGKSSEIRIVNTKRRLSKGEIERLVSVAKRLKTTDDAEAVRVQAKNDCEAYTLVLKNMINEGELRGMLPTGVKLNLNMAIDDTLGWVNANPMATTEEYVSCQTELEAVAKPILETVVNTLEESD